MFSIFEPYNFADWVSERQSAIQVQKYSEAHYLLSTLFFFPLIVHRQFTALIIANSWISSAPFIRSARWRPPSCRSLRKRIQSTFFKTRKVFADSFLFHTVFFINFLNCFGQSLTAHYARFFEFFSRQLFYCAKITIHIRQWYFAHRSKVIFYIPRIFPELKAIKF